VITTHSLEPLRPWKREQIGRGYELSKWVEQTAIEMADAVIAVSSSTRDDILRLFNVDPKKVHVILNGVDTEEYRPVKKPELLTSLGIDVTKSFVLFIGRMTRQKGLYYLLKAADFIDPNMQIVLCAGDSDTPSLQEELEAMVLELSAQRAGVIWIPEMVSRRTTVALYSHATVFCCPSIYEPFGIINLEAMACGTPVVATAVGGIPEVVADGETGFLVDARLSEQPPHDPVDADGLARALAEAINRFGADPDLKRRMGDAGRRRVVEKFSWETIAKQTLTLYESLQRS
jgi:glycogen synthase